jgi:hypothetical protein
MNEPPSGLRLIGVLVLMVLLSVLTSCGSSSPPPDALTGKSAAQVLELALHNAKAEGTMRYRITTQGSGSQQSVAGDASAKGGIVVVTNANGVVRIVVTGGIAYIDSNASVALQGVLGLSPALAGANTNKWISLTPTDSQFGQLATAASFSSTLTEFTPGGSQLHLTEKTVAGKRVGLIDGTGTPVVALQSYDIQLAVTTRSPVLPVGGAVSAQGNGKTATQIALFALWGKPFPLTAPTNATPLSVITHG